ncbi:putative methyltransferase PMT10 [Vitis vinifera]|uniref:Putative methyltransferase PMT10 n=1 Tax=Vitis vinifera TaxID=29760 RepID=A0A438K3M4_VITVI|nr:putative methyltransferase PMT10 [Vitis vinifera]
MKDIGPNLNFIKTPAFIKITAFGIIVLSCFYLGKHYSDGYQQLSFFSTFHSPQIDVAVGVSPNVGKFSDQNLNLTAPPSIPGSPPKNSKNAPPPAVERIGIVDEDGAMSVEFEVGEFDPHSVEDLGNSDGEEEKKVGNRDSTVKIENFRVCEASMQDYIPCLDNVEEIARLNSTERGEKYERHCPGKGEGLDCLVPMPQGYKPRIPWPASRDEVWFSNVPHTRLVEDKGGQNWISIKGDKFVFPGGGTQFIHGADQYLDQISQMVPDIAFGNHTRVVLDIGCGVASFGAFLLQRNVITLSIAPKDVHENQIQFALERGVPAMVAVFATHRLLYPSQAFDLIHCSRCRINWTRDDGILLLEVNRMLRAGGYFAWAAQPVYKHEGNLQEQWKEMEDLTIRLCWELVKKEGYIAIWRKPLNNSCYLNRDTGVQPPLCDPNDDPDDVCWILVSAEVFHKMANVRNKRNLLTKVRVNDTSLFEESEIEVEFRGIKGAILKEEAFVALSSLSGDKVTRFPFGNLLQIYEGVGYNGVEIQEEISDVERGVGKAIGNEWEGIKSRTHFSVENERKVSNLGSQENQKAASIGRVRGLTDSLAVGAFNAWQRLEVEFLLLISLKAVGGLCRIGVIVLRQGRNNRLLAFPQFQSLYVVVADSFSLWNGLSDAFLVKKNLLVGMVLSYVGMKPCITLLPENGYGANVTAWPARLNDLPERLQTIEMDAYISRKEILKADTKFWHEVIYGYVHAYHWNDSKLRNVMDMRAGFGGFAAALIDFQVDCWVMNVVPVSGFNTLPVIYDRGLIGVRHDWCQHVVQWSIVGHWGLPGKIVFQALAGLYPAYLFLNFNIHSWEVLRCDGYSIYMARVQKCFGKEHPLLCFMVGEESVHEGFCSTPMSLIMLDQRGGNSRWMGIICLIACPKPAGLRLAIEDEILASLEDLKETTFFRTTNRRCEPFDTYPRTYDLLHAAGLFSIEQKRCNISNIMLEMDRMLRPGGRVYIRDTVSVVNELHAIAVAMGWASAVHDTSEGPHASWRLLRTATPCQVLHIGGDVNEICSCTLVMGAAIISNHKGNLYEGLRPSSGGALGLT